MGYYRTDVFVFNTMTKGLYATEHLVLLPCSAGRSCMVYVFADGETATDVKSIWD